MTANQEMLSRLQALVVERVAQRQAIITLAESEDRKDLTVAETRKFHALTGALDELVQRCAEVKAEVDRSGAGDPLAARATANGDAQGWARRAAQAAWDASGGSEHRAITASQFDVPSLVELNVTPLARPMRLIDLLVNRKPLEGNAFEYFKQSVRTNNSAPVADNALKPTSIFTPVAVQDRARVIAHLSDPSPVRMWQDSEAVTQWLQDEMVQGVLDGLERQVITGDGSGENMTGVLHEAGTTAVAYTTDVPTTLRSALTTLQLAGERPTAVVLNPSDAQTVDLTRWGASGGFLSGGFANDNGSGFGSSANVFGDTTIQRVTSPSIPAGTGVLADWTKLSLYVREAVNLMLDLSGTLFQHNQFQLRAEGRFGLGWLRPSAFAVIDLTA